MKNRITLLFLVATPLLTGCGEKSQSSAPPVDNSMYCSNEIVNSYNDIGTKMSWYDKNHELHSLSETQKACEQYKSLIGQESCVAHGSSPGDLISLSAKTVDPLCNRAHRLLSPSEPEPNGPSADPNPAQPSPPVRVADLKKGLKLIVHDAVLLNQLLGSGSNMLIQDGKVVSSPHDLDTKENFCYLTKKDPAVEVRENDVVVVIPAQQDDRRLILASSDSKIEMGCAKADRTQDWTLTSLSQVFGVTVELQANDLN